MIVKLLALVTDAFGATGGIAQYNRDLLSALSDEEASNRIIVLPRHGHADPDELPASVRQLAPAGKFHFILTALRAAAMDGPFDAVFCGHINLVLLSAAIASILRVPLWLQLHGIEAWGPLSRAQLRAAERAALVTAVSRYTRRRFLGISHIDPGRVRVLPNTVGAAFAPGPKPNYLVNRHSLRGRQVLLTVGRLSAAERGKGHDRVIEAVKMLRSVHPVLTYLVVGDGDDRERLQAVARQAGVEDAVVFAGMVEPSELPDYYRVADVFVMPSTQEGFGIVFVEAAASGLMVIGGDRDGSGDALADGALGRVIDPMDGRQLVEAIGKALAGAEGNPASAHRYRFENFAEHVGNLTSSYLLRPSPTAAASAAG